MRVKTTIKTVSVGLHHHFLEDKGQPMRVKTTIKTVYVGLHHHFLEDKGDPKGTPTTSVCFINQTPYRSAKPV